MLASIQSLTALLGALALATLLAPRLRLPQPLALAFAGMALAFVPSVRDLDIDPQVILVGFLPPLLYADAFRTSWRDFRRWLRPILMLAIGLVALTIVTVGFVAKWMLPSLPWSVCFVLGAIVSPTDTVAAQAVIERLRVPRRITAILGGESMVNDATGLVGVQIGVVVTLHGMVHASTVAWQFAWVAGMGIVIGALCGVAFSFANRLVRDSSVLFTLSLLSPYLAYAAADGFGGSGVLAVVVAGAIVAWRIHTIAPLTRLSLRASWDQLAFLLNGLCFLYIGLESPCLLHVAAGEGRSLWLAGLAVAGTVIVTRIVWCFPNAYVPLWLFPRLRAIEGGYPPLGGVVLASWCGVRGAVSLAAALALPTVTPEGLPFPGRADVTACTLAVILATLFVQGATLHPLVKLLRFRDDGTTDSELRRAREQVLSAGIARLDAFCSENSCPVAVHRYRESMVDQLASLRADDDAERQHAVHRLAVSLQVRAAVLEAQESALLRLRDGGQLDDLAFGALLAELDHAVAAAAS
ncbi:MAG: Na+/H+ antiporter [Planctomycetes bacterium]|nr:Na+/H+ antiporter [Planctomycetota bacterium]